MLEELGWKVVYLMGVGVVIAVEHWGLAGLWRRYERARWTLGVGTVLGLALPLVLGGVADWGTWLLLLFGFGVAGAVTAGLYTLEGARREERRIQHLRGRIDEASTTVE